MDNKTKKGRQDDSQINVNESYELQYWSKKLNVTQEELREAVSAVGRKITAVEDYLSSK